MPTIAQSTVAVTGAIVNPSIVNEPIAILSPAAPAPVRSLLPPSEVLATVTQQGASQTGALPLWQIQATSGTSSSSQTSSTSTPSSTTSPTQGGVPAEVINVGASQQPYKTPMNTLESLVTVTFDQYIGDQYFAGVQIWFTNYHGNPIPQLMSTSTGSPAQLLCDMTGETVTITVVSYGSTGLTASFIKAPSVVLTLNGSAGVPPAPTMSQLVTALAGSIGWQFSWNVINGLSDNVIDGYWVYRSATDTTPAPPAGRINYIKQPVTNVGTLTYTDVVSGTYYYWVSAVSTSGLESSLTAAQSTSVSSTIYPTVGPSASYDGNEATYYEVSTSSTADSSTSPTTNSVSTTFSGFPAAPSPNTAITINLLVGWEGETSENFSGSARANAQAFYSLDNGTTWTQFWSHTVENNEDDNNYAGSYVNASLASGTDTTQVQVQITASTSATLSSVAPPRDADSTFAYAASGIYVYELNISVDQAY